MVKNSCQHLSIFEISKKYIPEFQQMDINFTVSPSLLKKSKLLERKEGT